MMEKIEILDVFDINLGSDIITFDYMYILIQLNNGNILVTDDTVSMVEYDYSWDVNEKCLKMFHNDIFKKEIKYAKFIINTSNLFIVFKDYTSIILSLFDGSIKYLNIDKFKDIKIYKKDNIIILLENGDVIKFEDINKLDGIKLCSDALKIEANCYSLGIVLNNGEVMIENTDTKMTKIKGINNAQDIILYGEAHNINGIILLLKDMTTRVYCKNNDAFSFVNNNLNNVKTIYPTRYNYVIIVSSDDNTSIKYYYDSSHDGNLCTSSSDNDTIQNNKNIKDVNILRNNKLILTNNGDAYFKRHTNDNRNDRFIIIERDVKKIIGGKLMLDNSGNLHCAGTFPLSQAQRKFNLDTQYSQLINISKIIPSNTTYSINDIISYSFKTNISVNKMTIYLKDDTTIMTCGNNQFGQLGLEDNKDRNILTKVPNINDVKQVCCSDNHSMLLFNDGTIATCGNNRFGQLGLGNNENKNTFTKVPGIKDVEQISCGGNSSMIKLTNGDVMTCGDNTVGQLCLGDNKNRNIFTKVTL